MFHRYACEVIKSKAGHWLKGSLLVLQGTVTFGYELFLGFF